MQISFLSTDSQTLDIGSEHFQLRVSPVNKEVARLYIWSPHDDRSRMPNTMKLYYFDTGDEVPKHDCEWFITWTESYKLELDGEVVYELNNPRQLVVNKTRLITSRDPMPL